MTTYSLLRQPLYNFRTTFINPTDSEIKTSIEEGWFVVGQIRLHDGKIIIESPIIDVFQDEYKTKNPTIDRWLQSRGNFTTFNEWIASADIPVS